MSLGMNERMEEIEERTPLTSDMKFRKVNKYEAVKFERLHFKSRENETTESFELSTERQEVGIK